MTFKDKVLYIQKKSNSLLCVGLDTDIAKLPDPFKSSNQDLFEFNKQIINATKDFVCAYKINLAFYESLGKYGWDLLERTIDLLPENCIKIADAKRGDIGNTSQQYAKAFFETLKFDSITVNPYLGYDSIKPFLDYKEKGVFILTLTSNPSSKDFQYQLIENEPLYLKVAKKIFEWNVNQNCCLVVGATHPNELADIRKIVPECPILIPGIGAQGGDLEMTIKNGCNTDGYLALINISRAIIYASQKDDYVEAAQLAAKNYNNKINNIRESYYVQNS